MKQVKKSQIRVTPNHSKRTFTIREYLCNGATLKFRTIPFSRNEFESMLYNTEEDWHQFLKTDAYYRIYR